MLCTAGKCYSKFYENKLALDLSAFQCDQSKSLWTFHPNFSLVLKTSIVLLVINRLKTNHYEDGSIFTFGVQIWLAMQISSLTLSEK